MYSPIIHWVGPTIPHWVGPITKETMEAKAILPQPFTTQRMAPTCTMKDFFLRTSAEDARSVETAKPTTNKQAPTRT